MIERSFEDQTFQLAGELRQRGISRYAQLAQLFRRRIETGEWSLGEQIPTIEELSHEFGVARETLRQALNVIENEGLIKRYRAKGTFVTGTPKELWCELQTSFFGLLQAREGVQIELLSEARKVPISGQIDFGVTVPAYRHLTRRHWRTDQPYMVADIYIDERLANQIPRSAFTNKTALKLVTDIPGIELTRVEQIMTIGTADMATSKALEIPFNAPVACVDRYGINDAGELVIFVRGVYRGDVVRLSVKLK
jgi:GntR family transcriptional regulator